MKSSDCVRDLFRRRFALELEGARDAVPLEFREKYAGSGATFADTCADALVNFVHRALPHEPALRLHVLERLLEQAASWPAGAGAAWGVIHRPLNGEPDFRAGMASAMLAKHLLTPIHAVSTSDLVHIDGVHVRARPLVGWPGDAAPNDVLRWLLDHGDDDSRVFARKMMERTKTGWSFVDLSWKRLELGDEEAIEDLLQCYELMAFAHVWLAWRDVATSTRTALGAACFAWASVRNDDVDSLAKMARGALAEIGEKAFPPTDEDAVRELVAELRAMLPTVLDAAGFVAHKLPKTEAEALVFEDGMLQWDAAFAAFLEGLGKHGRQGAEVVRCGARSRWQAFQAACDHESAGGALWSYWADVSQRPTSLRFGRALACILWLERVRDRVLAMRAKPAALTRAVSIDVLDLYSQRYKPEDRNGQQAFVFHGSKQGWVLVPSISDDALSGILQRGVDLLTSETGIDLLEWQVTEAHRQFSNGDRDYRNLRIEGGWSALAHDHLRLTANRAREEVRAIVLAQAHLRFESYGIRGNLLSYAEPQKAARGQRAVVTITLGDMLLVGFANALREEHGASSLTSREGRRLVPILGKTALVGRRNEYAAQRRMVWRFAIKLRDAAEQLAKDGSVPMPLDAWVSLAGEAGAPRTGAFLGRLLDAWEKGNDKTQPLIERQGDRVTLHESRRAAFEFLVKGGELSLRKRRDGKAAARGRARGWRGKRD